METMKGGNRMTIITTEIQKWKRNKIVWCILALTLLLGAFAIERACSISRSSPFMDSFGDLYTLAFKNLSSLFLPIVLGMFATTLFFDEHKNDTMKQLLIIPITKAQLYFSKVAVVILMSVGLCLITFLLCVVGGLIAGGFPDLNAQTLMDAGLLYLAGGILIPIAMLPIVFLSALSKGYILPIGATLLYLIPVVIAPAYLTGIHPLASVMGIYPHISEAAAAMVESLMQGVLFNTSPLDRCYICRRIRSGSKKAILLKGKTYETIELFITRYSACFFSLCLPAGRSIFRRGSRPTGHYGRSNRIL